MTRTQHQHCTIQNTHLETIVSGCNSHQCRLFKYEVTSGVIEVGVEWKAVHNDEKAKSRFEWCYRDFPYNHSIDDELLAAAINDIPDFGFGHNGSFSSFFFRRPICIYLLPVPHPLDLNSTQKGLINNISRLILDESEDSEEEFGLSDEDSDNCYESNHNSESELDVISSGSEDEGEEYLGKNGHVWSSKEPIKTRTKSSNIVVRCPGPKASLQIPKASDAFNLYFDDNTINVITKWTNQKIDTVKGNYKFRTFTYETSPDEIRALIGLTLLAGVGKGGSESTKSLFARDETGRNIFGAGMNERRFVVFLLNVLRFDNRESREERRKDDKLAPIRELWELFIAKCSSLYTPGTNCTIDESLLNFRGRCGFKQYIPNKPAKYGIKVFVLADSATYYFLTGKIYIGKDSNYDPNFSVPTNVVLELVKPIENTNRNITTDNCRNDNKEVVSEVSVPVAAVVTLAIAAATLLGIAAEGEQREPGYREPQRKKRRRCEEPARYAVMGPQCLRRQRVTQKDEAGWMSPQREASAEDVDKVQKGLMAEMICRYRAVCRYRAEVKQTNDF
ncbi:hypothetical protein LAZ67_13000936 [Cordylochernes scorpioides]|uniref:PiggyBac transposable element-derived protein domain-containing protein n=1 Tax=Cordylochernes scorpioides TaxID=51811 RepID=A0ABY6L893_9ARAC|nr:hypothetical protein LAZ67_13000936 [Cordylochernes scorpioides]